MGGISSANPNGIPSRSPGLRGTRYPGGSVAIRPQPQRPTGLWHPAAHRRRHGDEARHLFLEGVVGVGAGSAEPQLGILHRRAKLGLGVPGRWGVAAPGVIGGGDLVEVGIGEFAVDAVNEGAEFASVDEEGFFAAVAKADVTEPSAVSFNEFFRLHERPSGATVRLVTARVCKRILGTAARMLIVASK